MGRIEEFKNRLTQIENDTTEIQIALAEIYELALASEGGQDG